MVSRATYTDAQRHSIWRYEKEKKRRQAESLSPFGISFIYLPQYCQYSPRALAKNAAICPFVTGVSGQ